MLALRHEMNSGGGHDRIFVAHELRQRALEIAPRGSHGDLGEPGLLVQWGILEDWQHSRTDGAVEQVVEILEGRGARTAVARLGRMTRRGDVPPGINQAQQSIHAVDGAYE